MGTNVDASSPARAEGSVANGVAVTTAAFTPPNGSVLVVCVNGYAIGGADVTMSVSDSLSLTWTERAHQAGAEYNGGYAGIWTAVVTTGAEMTVSVTRTAGPTGGQWLSFKVYVVTGANLTSPVGKTRTTSTTMNAFNLSPIGGTGAPVSRGFGCGTDFNNLGLPTSADEEDAGTRAGEISYLSAYKANDITTIGVGMNLAFDAYGTAAAKWNVVIVEIKGAVATDQVAIDSASSASSGAASSVALPMFMIGGANRALLLFVNHSYPSIPTATATWSGGSGTFTRIGGHNDGINYEDILYFLNPDADTPITVTVNEVGSGRLIAGCVALQNVSQSTPFGTPVFLAGYSKTPSASVTDSATGDLVLATMGIQGAPTITDGDSQTRLYALQATSGTLKLHSTGSAKAGAAGTVVVSWTAVYSYYWLSQGITAKMVTAGGAVSRSVDTTVEATTLLVKTAAPTLEASATLSALRDAPLESVALVSLQSDTMVEGLPQLFQESVTSVEGLANLQPTQHVPLEAYQIASRSQTTSVEALTAVERATAHVIEALTTAAKLAYISVEALSTNASVIRAVDILLEAKVQASVWHRTTLEALRAVQRTQVASVEATILVSAASVATLEARVIMTPKVATASVEALRRIVRSQTVAIEVLRVIQRPQPVALPLEALRRASYIAIVSVESLGGMVIATWLSFGSMAGDPTKPIVIAAFDATNYTDYDFWLEIVFWTDNEAYAATVRLGYWTGTAWAGVDGSMVTTMVATPTLLSSPMFPLTGNRLYCIQFTGVSGRAPTISSAKLRRRPKT